MSWTDALLSHNLIEIDPAELLGYSSVSCQPSTMGFQVLVMKDQNLFLLTDSRGNIPKSGHCELGLFYEDTRFLSRWEFSIMGQQPTVLSSQANRVFCNQIDMTVSWDQGPGHDIYEHNYIHIRRRQVVSDHVISRIRISNYLNFDQHVTFQFQFAADFADMFEVRGMVRGKRGIYYRPILESDRVLLCYRGLDGVLRSTRIVFGQRPTRLSETCAEYEVTIPAGESCLLENRIIPLIEQRKGESVPVSYEQLYKRIADDYGEWRRHCTALHSDNEFLDTSLAQSITDLRALMISYGNQPILSAGIPWYSTPFGRDSIIASLQSLVINPDIARQTLLFLAYYQGTKVDDFTAEEPGKIMHEIRRGELASCGEIPHLPYYGTIDATPLWLILLHEYFLWTGDEALVRQLLPNAERALAWINNYGDVDGDGLVEYWKYTERGILHQGWKDSVDGVIYPDGTQPQLPIALVEVQGYVFDAKMRMSRLYRALGMPEQSRRLRTEALELQQRIEERFWMKDQRYYALGLDGRKRPIPSITSNGAHLLYSHCAPPVNAGRVERRLMSDDMYSGWGIRTFSERHPAYNPLSYHNGTVWPHDNALIVVGLCNYNLKRSAERVFTNLYEACLHFQYYRLPELFCGMLRQPNDSPVHYPVACTPQAWAAATFFLALQGLLGIRPDAPRSHLYIENPLLPRVISDLVIHDMRVGQARVTLRVTRQNERTFVNVVEQTGEPVRVTIEWD